MTGDTTDTPFDEEAQGDLFSRKNLEPARSSHREEDANYDDVVVQLNDRWRVIRCRDGVQWILQRRVGSRHGRARYQGRSFCRTSEALIRLCHTFAGVFSDAALAILKALPRRI